jgi:hypothetical protein
MKNIIFNDNKTFSQASVDCNFTKLQTTYTLQRHNTKI